MILLPGVVHTFHERRNTHGDAVVAFTCHLLGGRHLRAYRGRTREARCCSLIGCVITLKRAVPQHELESVRRSPVKYETSNALGLMHCSRY